ncbi:MAG: DUF99 family protein [Promethearchaeati archaeon SRVP18_Atabeyarchaeia-1]
MRLHPFKKGMRVLGIAESFSKGEGGRSVLAGIVMRKDLVIDGFAVTGITVGGMDATEGVLQLYKSLERTDVNLIMIAGCVIAWFNVLDLARVSEEVHLPLICVTYEESEGLEKYFKEYFPQDWEKRLSTFNRNCTRNAAELRTGYRVFIRELGIEFDEAVRVLDSFTLEGGVPEPLRLARLLARTIHKSQTGATLPE